MAPHYVGQALPGLQTDAGAHLLHGRHERQGEQGDPKLSKAEERPGL
jgi:hypothetical protein